MRIFIGFLLLVLPFFATLAQDAHYWTEQYGTRSMLLSNSIIGSVEDLGAVFYNPARLSVIEENAFMVSGKVYQLSSYSFETDGGNNNTPKRKSEFGGAPSLLAGTFGIKGLEKHSFAYSLLGRRNMDLNLNEGSSLFGDVLPNIPGEEYLSGDAVVAKAFNEEWLGLSWSYTLNPQWSIGLSTYGTIRKQNVIDEANIQAYMANNDVEVYSSKNRYDYTHLGLLWKLGLAWEKEAWSLGLTMTTPTVSLMGDGSFHYEKVYTGITDGKPIYEHNTQSEIDMTYKTPFSVGGGVGYQFKKGSIHASAEYFHSVSPYTLMKGQAYLGQSTGKDRQSFLLDELQSVMNFGIGYHFVLSDAINGYLSYSTDFSAAVGSNESTLDFRSKTYASTFTSDINHFGGGIVLKFKRADITLGTSLAQTNYSVERPMYFPDETNVNRADLQSRNVTTDVRWNRWNFIVGISIPFLDDFTKKWENKLLNNGSKVAE